MYLHVIIPLLMAALIGLSLALAWHLYKLAEHRREVINGLYRQIDDLENSKDVIQRDWKQCHWQLNAIRDAVLSKKVEYFIRSGRTTAAVIRRSIGDDAQCTVTIKSFVDSDADFNRREAEELLERLNA